jgi:hypothetical protein
MSVGERGADPRYMDGQFRFNDVDTFHDILSQGIDNVAL